MLGNSNDREEHNRQKFPNGKSPHRLRSEITIISCRRKTSLLLIPVAFEPVDGRKTMQETSCDSGDGQRGSNKSLDRNQLQRAEGI